MLWPHKCGPWKMSFRFSLHHPLWEFRMFTILLIFLIRRSLDLSLTSQSQQKQHLNWKVLKAPARNGSPCCRNPSSAATPVWRYEKISWLQGTAQFRWKDWLHRKGIQTGRTYPITTRDPLSYKLAIGKSYLHFNPCSMSSSIPGLGQFRVIRYYMIIHASKKRR